MQVTPADRVDTAEGSLKAPYALNLQKPILKCPSPKPERGRKAVAFVDYALGCPLATVHVLEFCEEEPQVHKANKNSCCSAF